MEQCVQVSHAQPTSSQDKALRTSSQKLHIEF